MSCQLGRAGSGGKIQLLIRKETKVREEEEEKKTRQVDTNLSWKGGGFTEMLLKSREAHLRED